MISDMMHKYSKVFMWCQERPSCSATDHTRTGRQCKWSIKRVLLEETVFADVLYGETAEGDGIVEALL